MPGGVLSGTETVLLVEDDPGVRELATKALERFGYTVLAAHGAAEAIDAAKEHTGPVHLVLSDV